MENAFYFAWNATIVIKLFKVLWSFSFLSNIENDCWKWKYYDMKWLAKITNSNVLNNSKTSLNSNIKIGQKMN